MTGNDAGLVVGHSNGAVPQGAPVAPDTTAVASQANPSRTSDETAPAPIEVSTGTNIAASEEVSMRAASDSLDGQSQTRRNRRTARRQRDAAATDRGGRLVAWAGFVFGSAFSILMNWLHTWLPAEHMPKGWSPGVAPQFGSAVWPVCLLISVEVLSRVRWQPGLAWLLARYGGVGTVAGGSAVISYGHVHDVLERWGYGTVGAGVGPLVLDGLMVACGFALMSENTPQRDTAIAPESGEVNERKAFRRSGMPTDTSDTRTDVADTASDASDIGSDAPDSTPDTDATAGDTVLDLDRDNRIRAMYRVVPSTREVGAAFGLHHSTVARIVAQDGSGDTGGDGAAPLRLIAATDEGGKSADITKSTALLIDSIEEKL